MFICVLLTSCCSFRDPSHCDFYSPEVGEYSGSAPNTDKDKSEQPQCGKVMLYKNNVLVLGGTRTMEGDWPWHVAIYQTLGAGNQYKCGGTLVSNSHVITAAHCVTRKRSVKNVNKNTLTVYLGSHNLKTFIEGLQVKLVENIIVHPEYSASTFSRDIAILQLRATVEYTPWVQPICIWPEDQVDLQNVIGKVGTVVGWGYDESGKVTEGLLKGEMPVVDQETCLRSHPTFFIQFTSSYTYCAGYRNGTSVCNGDSGGGMVFEMNKTWYLRGLASVSLASRNENRCDPSHYMVFTDVAKFSPWILQNINDF